MAEYITTRSVRQMCDRTSTYWGIISPFGSFEVVILWRSRKSLN